jgi:hypothetical protein
MPKVTRYPGGGSEVVRSGIGRNAFSESDKGNGVMLPVSSQ